VLGLQLDTLVHAGTVKLRFGFETCCSRAFAETNRLLLFIAGEMPIFIMTEPLVHVFHVERWNDRVDRIGDPRT
jgi:hypothetical protein